MKIVKVKNKKMYEGNNPEGIHYYAFYWNQKYQRYNAVQLTHIAKKDDKRYSQVKRGIIKNIRLNKIDKYADSGIRNKLYISDVNGMNLHPNMGLIVINRVSGSSTKKIKEFGTKIVCNKKQK